MSWQRYKESSFTGAHLFPRFPAPSVRVVPTRGCPAHRDKNNPYPTWPGSQIQGTRSGLIVLLSMLHGLRTPVRWGRTGQRSDQPPGAQFEIADAKVGFQRHHPCGVQCKMPTTYIQLPCATDYAMGDSVDVTHFPNTIYMIHLIPGIRILDNPVHPLILRIVFGQFRAHAVFDVVVDDEIEFLGLA